MQLSGAHVLLTGASRGIGASIAAQARSRGATVTGVARSGGELVCDLTDRADRADLVARAEALAGPVDVLVNCAGVDASASLLEVEADPMAALFEVNLLAPAELVRQALPGMVARRRGHVVTVSSGFSTIAGPGLTPYCSSKAGLSHFHAGMVQELRGTGVGATLVEPGPVRTDMYADIEGHRLAAAGVHRLLALRLTSLVEPEDVARQVLDAVERGRGHVAVPARMVSALALPWLARRVGELALTGVPRR